MPLDLAPAPHRIEKSRAVIAAALDVGMGKTACLAAPMSCTAPGQYGRPLEVIGAGLQSARAANGAGDFDSCARAIRIAIDEAERGADATIRDVVAAYSGPGLASRLVRGQARVRGAQVSVRDAQAALAAAIHGAPSPGRAALHIAPLGYSVDGGALTPDPRGMTGRTLLVEACIVTAPGQAIDALRQCIRAAGVEPAEIVAAPYAAALGVASDDERAQSVLVLDLGAGGVGVSVLGAEGLAFVDHVAMGGARMTRDLAKVLNATFPAAERAKLLHGVVGGAYDAREAIETPRIGEDGRLEAQIVAKRTFHDALAPRFREMILTAKARMVEARLAAHRVPQRAILTGGGAQIAGARETAQELLNLPVRVGRPMGVNDIDAGRAGPAFAVGAGLLRWRLDRPPEAAEAEAYEPTLREVGASATAAATRAWAWLKEHF